MHGKRYIRIEKENLELNYICQTSYLTRIHHLYSKKNLDIVYLQY
jgi:hypothetical protein